MGNSSIYAGSSRTELPSPTSIKHNDEIIWSTNTGRTSTGKMVGDVIAEKKNLEITWEFLRDPDIRLIRQQIKAGFFDIWLPDCGETLKITAYRSTLAYEDGGPLGDGYGHLYRTATVSVIQQ